MPLHSADQCHRSAAISVHYTKAVYTVKSAPEDGWVCRPKHVEQIKKINKSINKRNLLHLVGCLHRWFIHVKVKCSRYRLGVAQRVDRGTALLFHDCGTRRGWVVSSTPRPHFTPVKTRYPFYRRLCGPQGRSGWAENLVPTGIRLRTVQPVAQSLYRLSYRAQDLYT